MNAKRQAEKRMPPRFSRLCNAVGDRAPASRTPSGRSNDYATVHLQCISIDGSINWMLRHTIH